MYAHARPHARRYIGKWRANALHGAGTLVYADGALYDGEFARGRPHGAGRQTYVSG